ncbi:MAG: ATP-binding protein [Clostridia bacterium]|nr:ATP-binding protein [Clostridia bacterium]
MKENIVRIESITISNFKNVVNGVLSFENTRKPYTSSILGLYGQNGSGKTALIDVIALLKYALCGQVIPVQFCDYINVDAEYSTLKYEFKVVNGNTGALYTAAYEFSIRKDLDDSSQNTGDDVGIPEQYKVTLFNEVLSYSYECGEEKKNLLPVIDTRTEDAFVPKTKYDALTGKNKSVETDLIVAKKLAKTTSRSFVFSKELLTVIRNNCKEPWRVFLMESLVSFGNFGLFVINTANSGLISMNALPLAFKYEEKSMGAVGNLMLPLNGAETIPQEAVDIVKKVIDHMNIVLSQIIPGLTISVKDLGSQLLKNGKVGCKIQMMSHKNSKEIPLQYESDGIKKIVSILQLLIVVYNKPSITVAIDELDSGVFEYLLGEILRIISEKGKGQLIFTSHNLRPLETLDRGFIAFTTTNPSNRYIRLSNVKSNNNLRDFYYRDIVLGEQSEVVYEPTNNYEIALAFREAGELSGS